MMEKKNVSKRMRGLLAAGLWTFGLAVCPLHGEAALPTHPLPSSPAAADTASAGNGESGIRIRVDHREKAESGKAAPGENAADRIWSKVKEDTAPVKSAPENRPRQEETAQETVSNRAIPPVRATPPARTAEPVIVPAHGSGYTEAEIREQIQRKYTQPRPEFRLVSGAFAGSGYRPGTMDVKIPTLFFPPDVMQDVSETFPENPDGTFGTRTREDVTGGLSSYGAEARQQLLKQAGEKTGGHVPETAPLRKGPAAAKTKLKTITVQVPVPAPSPFRPLAKGDFYWFGNHKGNYVTALPGSLSRDPLLQVPANGPMLIRETGQHEFMAVTVDDPADTYYYKNQDTFPGYGKAVPVFTETRKTVQGDDVSIKYIRRYMEGEQCLIVDSAAKRAGKTYRVAVIFPESKQYEYLPKALYVIENLKGT